MNKRGQTILLALAVILAGHHPVGALPPKDIATPDSIMSQAVSGDDAQAPYLMQGEALVAMLQDLVGLSTPGSSIVFNRSTGQIFVKSIPADHRAIEEILGELRESTKRQVEIETRIITVAATDFEGLGANLNELSFLSKNVDLANPGSGVVFGTGTVGSQAITTSPTRTGFPDLNSIFSSVGIGGSPAIGFSKAGVFDIQTFIDVLSRYAQVNTLAAPRITVFNNQQANITIRKHAFYISKIDTDFTSTSAGSSSVLTAAQDADVAIAQSGTVLDVTPTINANGSITLELHPAFVRTDVTGSQSIALGIAAASNSVTLPVYTVQEINTTVTLENGGVVVLGGLITEEEVNQHDKVPGLGSIPVFGKLFFQSNQVKNVKSYLLVFVKAKLKSF